MGNQNKRESECLPSTTIPGRYPLPNLTSGKCELFDVDLITSDIGAEMMETISRLIINHMIESHTQESNFVSQSLCEDRFLKKKWRNTIRINPTEMFPVFDFSQEELKPRYTIPDPKEICEFVNPTFNFLKVQYECAIIMMIYIERLIQRTYLVLSPENWRSVVFGTLMLASKYWEDPSIMTMDFAVVYQNYSLKSINLLQGICADHIQWDFFVTVEEYTSCYSQIKNSTKSAYG